MVKAFAVFSTLAAFVVAVTASNSVPPDQAWQVVDTHTQQPDCLTATNRKCDVIDIAQVTQEGRWLIEAFGSRINSNGYTASQYQADTTAIANNWKRTADILTASLPLDEIHDFYQRMAAADMIHWTQHLPLFTVFHGMAADKSKVLLDSATVNAGIQAIYTQSDILADVAYEYLPLEPPIIREQIGNLRQWLTDEFVDTLNEFPAA